MFSWSDTRERIALPIDQKLDEILKLLKNHQVVVCEAETGAGKTTRIGQAAILANPQVKVVMTQTRRTACRWNGSRIASELGCQPGGLVGWSLSGEDKKTSNKTRLELIVDQTLINRLRYKKFLPKGLIIIDEAHERSLSIDLLLGLIQQSLKGSTKTQVLIMSATIDTKKFSDFFGKAPIVHVAGRCFPVCTEMVPLLHGEHHTQAAARAAGNVIQRFLQGKLEVPGPAVVKKGSVLILVPGKEDIDAIMQSLFQEVRDDNRIQIFACHGQSSAEDQERVQSDIPEGTLRFICGTEVLRSSVTVRETVGVIDSLQIKRRITDAKGVAHLSKIPISKAEANQGKGRAGRTEPGFYMPVTFQDEFDKLAEWPEPAIMREPIGKIALEVANLGRSVRDFNFIDAPPQDKIELALRRLKALGAIDNEERITETGKLLVRFPLDPEQAKVLVTAQKLGVLEEALIVTAFLEVEDFFFQGKADRTILVDEPWLKEILKGTEFTVTKLPPWVVKNGLQWEIRCGDKQFPHTDGARYVTSMQRKVWAGSSQNDFVALIEAYRAFKKAESQFTKNREKKLEAWCSHRGLKYKQIRLVEEKIRQILDDVAATKLAGATHCEIAREFSAASLMKAMASGKVDHIARALNRGRLFEGDFGQFKLVNESACSLAPFILIGGIRKVPIKNRAETEFFLLADLAAPLEIDWLLEALPHLCQRSLKNNYRYDLGLDQVVEKEKILFKEEPFCTRWVAAPDKQAAENFLDWLCEQQQRMPSIKEGQLRALLEANMDREEKAEELNLRAGKPLFELFPGDRLKAYFLEKLNGAKRLKEIKNLKVLALPSLDQNLIDRISRENPLTIRIQDIEFTVDYDQSPSIECKTIMRHWLPYFSAPITLSGGRAVEVEVSLAGNPLRLQWNSNARLDLSGLELSQDLNGLDLSGMSLIGTNMSRANLSKTSLAQTIFDNTTIFPQDVDKPPLFLGESDLRNAQAFEQALQRFSSHPQSSYITWCVIKQVGVDWLPKMVPHLCQSQRKGNYRYIFEVDRVMETEVIHFKRDFKISQDWVAAQAAPALETFAQWLCTKQMEILEFNSPLTKLLLSNAKREHLARKFNQRAGVKVFNIHTQEQLKAHFVSKLNGATCVKEILNIEDLALPALDPNQMQLILKNNPDTISILGREFNIEYDQFPSIASPIAITDLLRYFSRPSTLPSGRKVEVTWNSSRLKWTAKNRLDLSYFDLSKSDINEDLSDVNLLGANLKGTRFKSHLAGTCLAHAIYDKTTLFPANTAKDLAANQLPVFLEESEIMLPKQFEQALNRLNAIDHPQFDYIAWCVAKQVVSVAKAHNAPHLLTALYKHPLVGIKGFFNSFFSVFSKPEETEIQKYLSKAILR